MEFLSNYILTINPKYLLLTITIVSFLESLAIIGLILPGLILMSLFGTFIGNGKINFYSAWICGFIGCILGDWISYYIGYKCKCQIYNLKIFKKNISLIEKIKKSLLKYCFITIFIGKLIGPIRPFVPIIAGTLNLPLKKIIFPNLIGCLVWPPLYLIPGIFTEITINNINKIIKKNSINIQLINKFFLFIVVFFSILTIIKYIKNKNFF
ncbi:Inner membrane protein YabI [Buchnera aphidicola (Tetraneura ulmi)]|uniref:DedA family protein n=1 Tax=Buchnera aphidicola TaxID=9 RepID=UPI003463968D